MASFLGIDAASEAAPRKDTPAIEARPVRALTIGPGRKLWVFVFPARPEGKGKPPKGEDPPAEACDDINDQTLSAELGFQLAGPVTFNIKAGSLPVSGAEGAIRDSFSAWEIGTGVAVGSVFTINSTGGANVPADDGNNSVGWVKISPRSTLAATWIWTQTNADGVDEVTDVDIFYNQFHKWGVFSTCNEQGRYEVQSVGTHEVGHVIGMAHVQDAEAMATM